MDITGLKNNLKYQIGVEECVCHVDYPIGNCGLCDAKQNLEIVEQMEREIILLREEIKKLKKEDKQMKIEIDPNNIYGENGQWVVHLGSMYDGCRDKKEVIEKALAPAEVFEKDELEKENYATVHRSQ